MESFQLHMGLSFPFLRANDLRTSLLIMRTRSLSYVGLFLNLIANAVNSNDQHVRSGTNVRMSQNPHQRRKMMGAGIIIARRTEYHITSRTETSGTSSTYGVHTHRLDSDVDADADADMDADADVPHRVLTWLED